MMNDVAYAFEWCSSTHSQGFELQSLHATKLGAFKAMTSEANGRWNKRRNMQLSYGSIGMDPLRNEEWRIRKVAINND